MASTSKIALCKYGSCEFIPGNAPPVLPARALKPVDMAIVSHSPNVNDLRTQSPISGSSKQILEAVLTAHMQESFDVVNVTCCSPAQYQPTGYQLIHCLPRLIEDIHALRPKQILCLGKVAASIILGTESSIDSLRGKVHYPPHEKLHHIKTYVTLHPGAVLRKPDSFMDLYHDIERLTAGIKPWENGDVYVATDEAGAIRNILPKEKSEASELTFDFETTTFSPHTGEILCLGIAWSETSAIVIPQRLLQLDSVKGALWELFYNRHGIRKIGHNVKFDTQWMMKLLDAKFPFPGADDTMLMHYILDERRGTHGLKRLVTLELGAPDYDAEIWQYLTKKTESFANISSDILYKYCGMDCIATLRLYHKLAKRMRIEDAWSPYHKLLQPGSEALVTTEYEGIPIDLEYLDKLSLEYNERLAEIELTLKETYQLQNPRSPMQVGKIMFDDIKLPPLSWGKKTTKEALNEYARRFASSDYIVAFCDLMLEHRKLSKLLQTYVVGLEKREVNGRIYGSWLLHGTVSGRAASRNPNMHNIPRDSAIKNAFIADEGHLFINADYEQVEFRLMAIFSKDEWLQEQFLQGRKFHDEVATELYGPDFTYDQKIRAKAINFGIPYGRSAKSIALEHKMSIQEAQELLDAWFDRMPKMRTWITQVQRKALKEGELETPFGRKRRFPLITDANKITVLKEAVAFLPQSTASDITLLALIELQPLLRSFDARVVNWIHDALLIECPSETAEELAKQVKSQMELIPESIFEFPFPVEIAIGNRWGNLSGEKD